MTGLIWRDSNSDCPGCYAEAGEMHTEGCDWNGRESVPDHERQEDLIDSEVEL